MEIAQVLDSVIERPVLVFGSLPPVARDLDVLARQPERATLESALLERGFERHGTEWVQFGTGSATAVDIVDADDWQLPPAELRALFDDAIPLEGARHLCRPAPHHALLILARRMIRSGELDGKRRDRVAQAVAEEPHVWERAARRSPLWGSRRALALLRNAYENRSAPSAAERVLALTEEDRARDSGGSRSPARAVKRVARRGPGGHVVTFSGLDGSGKSTQAENLRAVLEGLGYEAVIEWTKIARDPSLDAIARPVKAVVARFRKKEVAPERRTLKTGDGVIVLDEADAVAKDLRRKSALVTNVWTALVAVTNAQGHRRATMKHVRAGRVVICDRYTLDTAAHLRYRYGRDRRFRFQAWLNRILSPKPARSFFLDVSPAAAYARKAEQYEVDELELLRRLYLEESVPAKVHVVDGERPLDELSVSLGREVWRALKA